MDGAKPPADDFENAERFKRLFVDPAVDAMSAKVEAHLTPILAGQRKLFAQMQQQTERDNKQDERITNLESSNKKAMVGWGVFATGLSIALSACWNWVSSLFKGGHQ